MDDDCAQIAYGSGSSSYDFDNDYSKDEDNREYMMPIVINIYNYY